MYVYFFTNPASSPFKCAHYFFFFLWVITHYSVRTIQMILSIVKNYKSGYSIVIPASASLLLLSTAAPPEFSVF